jgi:AMIN domain
LIVDWWISSPFGVHSTINNLSVNDAPSSLFSPVTGWYRSVRALSRVQDEVLPLAGRQSAAFSLLAVALLAANVRAQVASPSRSSFAPLDEANAPPALVRSVRMIPGPDGPAVEIITTRPMVPRVTLLDDPERLVIDLPKALIPVRRRVAFRSEEVRAVRVDQYQTSPETVRVVLDLTRPCRYSWDAAGNRLMVRLYSGDAATFVAASPSSAVAPALVPARGGSEELVPQSSLGSGASLTAGSDTAVLRLEHGGQVRVCPGTTVSVTSSQDGRDLMLGMSTGAVETHYTLGLAADSIITPDFRILMAGPGEFHYAISADSRGNTCVRALPGNAASVIVSELMGTGVYQVKPAQQVVFEKGTLKQVDSSVPSDCGCPAPRIPVLRTAAEPAAAPLISPPAAPQADARSLPAPPTAELPGQTGVVTDGPETAKLPASHPNDIHVQVDAPFVFRATDPRPAPGPAPADIAALPAASSYARALPLEVEVLPPPVVLPAVPIAQAQATHHGFFGTIKNFFAGIFR